jgi:hypothetical protein
VCTTSHPSLSLSRLARSTQAGAVMRYVLSDPQGRHPRMTFCRAGFGCRVDAFFLVKSFVTLIVVIDR